ncbi:MAG: hypothetical protein IKV88_07290, partial [Clostridia bacterium]|nr:hypothetical protein [Clostridia bacterium]
ETYDPETYFASIPGWNGSATKEQFTIHSWDGKDADIWGNSLKYENGPYNESARIYLDGSYDTVGMDFSFRFESVSNNVNLSFRNYSDDLYVLSLNSKNQVSLLGNVVATYETDVWHDISIVFSKSKKYAKLKIKPSSSDEWEEFDGFYSGTNSNLTEALIFDIYGGAQNDGGVKYFDNMRVYIPVFELDRGYVKSGNPDSADIDETVVFEYTDNIDENIEPTVIIEKDGEITEPAYEILAEETKVQIKFEELEEDADYMVYLWGICSVFGEEAPTGIVEFTTSDYAVKTESISVSGDKVNALIRSAYANGTKAYIVASAFDADDNMTKVKLHPVQIPSGETGDFTFNPAFDGPYSYMKAMVIRDFASGISYSANVSETGGGKNQSESSDKPVAISNIVSDGDTFTVRGQNISQKDSIITIQTLKDNKVWKDLDGFDYESGNICEILAGFDAVSDIGYGDGYSFTSKLVDGKIPSFRIRFGNGMFEYYNPELIESINNAQSDTELEEIIKGDEPLFSGIEPVFENLTTQEQEKFWQILLNEKNILAIEGKEWVYNSDVIKFAMDASVLARLICIESPEELENLIYYFANEGYFTCDSYDIFAGVGSFKELGMSDSQKMALCSYLLNNISAYSFAQEFFDDFNENVIFYAIKGGSPSVIDKILSESNLIDTGRIPTYFRLNASTEKKVCKKLAISNLYESFESLYNAVEKYSKDQLGIGGGASGGGGGGGSSTTPSYDVTYEKSDDGSVIYVDCENVSADSLSLVVAFYRRGKLVDICVSENKSGEFTTNVPYDTEKLMVLESLQSMKPLVSSDEIKDVTDYENSNNYAYVLNAAFNDADFTSAWQMKILTKDNEVVIYTVRSEIIADGEPLSTDTDDCEFLEQFVAVKDTNDADADKGSHRLIRYTLDSKKRISEIYTIEGTHFGSENYDGYERTLGDDIELSRETAVFNIASEKSDDYFAENLTGLNWKDVYSGYYIANDEGINDCLIITAVNPHNGYTQNIGVVSSVSDLNSEIQTEAKRVEYRVAGEDYPWCDIRNGSLILY